MSTYKLINGDCIEEMKKMDANSIDSIVTDPPYEIGFMGKKWDNTGIAYNKQMWAEVLRVLKPGGHMLAFSSTRTYHRMVCAIEDAGFEIRDQLAWIYGTGFPKGYNVGKKMKKKQYEGLVVTLKPANEPIVLARKPLSEKTIVNNILKYNTGAINISRNKIDGKWPTNILLDGSEEVESIFPNGSARFFYASKASKIDRNSGCEELPKKGYKMNNPRTDIKVIKSWDMPDEKGSHNNHPTLKPVDVMCWLVRLITPLNGIVLDPFMGSGSTGKACMLENFSFIGIDLTKEYIVIAEKRIEHAKKQYEKEHANDKFFVETGCQEAK